MVDVETQLRCYADAVEAQHGPPIWSEPMVNGVREIQWQRRNAGWILAVAVVVAVLGAVWIANETSSTPDVSTDPEPPATSQPAVSSTTPTSSQPGSGDEESSPDPSPGVDSDTSVQVWTEIDPAPSVSVGELASSGGVFYISGENAAGEVSLATSVDGVDWITHELPDQLRMRHFAAGPERWAVVAIEPVRRYPTVQTDDGPALAPAERVLVSDDRGETWTELGIDFTTATLTSSHLLAGTEIVDVAVVGSTVVAKAVTNMTVPDVAGLLTDIGLIDPAQEICGYEYGMGGAGIFDLVFRICGGGELPVDDLSVFGPDSSQIATALSGESVIATTMLTSVDSEPMQPTATTNVDASLVVNGGSFVVVDTDTALISSDGVTWTSTAVTGLVSSRQTVEGPNGLWSHDTQAGPDTTLRYSLDGATWETVATIDGFAIHDLTVGPAGLAALAASTDDQSTPSQWWLGWSTDGTSWQWQSNLLAIRSGNARLAVGTNEAIALVNQQTWFSTNK